MVHACATRQPAVSSSRRASRVELRACVRARVRGRLCVLMGVRSQLAIARRLVCSARACADGLRMKTSSVRAYARKSSVLQLPPIITRTAEYTHARKQRYSRPIADGRAIYSASYAILSMQN